MIRMCYSLWPALLFCMCFNLFFTSTSASINEYCATDKVPSTDVLIELPWEKIRVLIFYIVPSSLCKSLVRRTMRRGCKLDRELFPYWRTCLIWSILGKRGEILVINFQGHGVY